VTGRVGSVLEMIQASMAAYPERPALGITDGKEYSFISYHELKHLVESIAAGLIGRGIKVGDRVGILLDDRAVWGLFYLGILRAGAVAVPLDNLQKTYEWASILNEAKPAAIFVSSAYSDDLLEEIGDIPTRKNWLAVDTEHEPKLASRVPAGLTGEPLASWPSIDSEMTAMLVFTSGTTSKPKGVILTHRNLASDIEAIHKLCLFDANDRFLSVLPIHHTFECTVGFLNPLCQGSSVAYARGLKSREIIEDLKSSQATALLAVPLLYEKVAGAIKRRVTRLPPGRRKVFDFLFNLSRFGNQRLNVKLSRPLFRSLRRKAGLDNLRLLVSGGAALPPEIGEFMDTLGLPILQGYGLTETSPAVSFNPPSGYKYDSVGPPLPGVQMKIINPDAAGVGEIAARGKMITPGYLNLPEETEKLFADGWLLTGDLGWKDDDGHYHISGRAKNIIVTPAGKNVYPEEIEMLIAESPLVLEALVFGETKPGETRERIACAVVPDTEYITTEMGNLPPDKIRQMLTTEVQQICARLADYKRPTEIIVRDTEFEKTSTRKIKRFLFARTKEELFPVDPEAEKNHPQ